MHWREFADQAPRLADLGRQRLEQPGVVLIGTIRRDGTPRISPVEPLLWEEDLWLSMLFGSRKAADLRRDQRVLVHSIVTNRDGGFGEYKLRVRPLRHHPAPPRRATRRRSGRASAGNLRRGASICSASTSTMSPSSATRKPRETSL